MRLFAALLILAAVAACAPVRGPVDKLPPHVSGTVPPSPDDPEPAAPGIGQVPGHWSPDLL
ncbi:MAG: hypothetical protein AB1918_16175 [Pseudomonadota bacterium]